MNRLVTCLFVMILFASSASAAEPVLDCSFEGRLPKWGDVTCVAAATACDPGSSCFQRLTVICDGKIAFSGEWALGIREDPLQYVIQGVTTIYNAAPPVIEVSFGPDPRLLSVLTIDGGQIEGRCELFTGALR